MLQRIRLAVQDRDSGGKLGGSVEVDETYIGGKARNMHESKRRALSTTTYNQYTGENKTVFSRWAGKVAVMGLLERNRKTGHSRVVTFPVPDVKQNRLHAIVKTHVEAGSNVYTDALQSYKGLDSYQHRVIDHAEKYVDGQVHTNGMESYWSLLKRTLSGTYISVEPFHLFRYLDEQAFRFNNRKDLTDAERFSLAITGIVGRRLRYKELIAALNAISPM
jgi:transposase-like protein